MLLWRKDVNVIVHSYSVSHIDAVIAKEDGIEGWRFTGVYGHLEAAKRIESWKLLRSLRRSSIRPWLCAGDFNEILSQDEKAGAPRPRKQIEEFRDCLFDCQVANVCVRLDRACASSDWMRTRGVSNDRKSTWIRPYAAGYFFGWPITFERQETTETLSI
ncbi:UNVERIFIED_CONTAM: hypothetical protein Sradi_2106200 [Sesamum radiatum]|uniref:Endonuclease/exonuclease/phosphatase domain-containing protein n=1 Tax=Sesamum radiatum TaxID=300843 RepID=A0AAW2TIZ9_SESRA